MKILVTGFDPFGGEPLNAGWEAVRALPDAIGAARIVKAQLPTSFRRSAEELYALVERHDPEVTVNVGQAGGACDLRVERVAINVDDASIPDNDGDRPADRPIQLAGPTAYFSSLPIQRMVAAMTQAGVPASVSNSAGTFVCNHIFYTTRALADRERSAMLAGFVHVPFLPQQVLGKPDTPAMALESIVKGLSAALAVISA